MEFTLNSEDGAEPRLSAFLDLAAEFGCGGIEPRANLGHRVFDGIAPARKETACRPTLSSTPAILGRCRLFGLGDLIDRAGPQRAIG